MDLDPVILSQSEHTAWSQTCHIWRMRFSFWQASVKVAQRKPRLCRRPAAWKRFWRMPTPRSNILTLPILACWLKVVISGLKYVPHPIQHHREEEILNLQHFCHQMPSVLWCCWLGVRKCIWPIKVEWWGAGMVICLVWGANDLHMGPADATATPSPLASLKSRMV